VSAAGALTSRPRLPYFFPAPRPKFDKKTADSATSLLVGMLWALRAEHDAARSCVSLTERRPEGVDDEPDATFLPVSPSPALRSGLRLRDPLTMPIHHQPHL
jgi:hypothetical protein